MLIAQLRPDPGEPNLAGGFTVPRGSAMHSLSAADDATACEFRTAQDVTLWPLEIVSASYFSFAPDLPLTSLPVAQRIRGGVRLRLKTTAGLVCQLALDRLPVYLTGRDDVVNALYELCLGAGLGTLVLPVKGQAPWQEFTGAGAIRPLGFSDAEALLPVSLRSFRGYRLLQEYFAFPQRYRFFELGGLGKRSSGRTVTGRSRCCSVAAGDPRARVDASNFALLRAINLFQKRVDRIHVTDSTFEYHVVPDRTRPQDYEIYQVTDVTGHGAGAEGETVFRPFYAAYSADAKHTHSAYFTARREPRLMSATQKRRGTRSSYIGTEVFLSLVDSAHAPFDRDLRQLSVQALCTNRDLVLLMPVGSAKGDLALDAAAPLAGIRVIAGPSRPFAPLVDGSIAWRAISHLSLNYLSLVDTTPQEGAAALRDLLELYAATTDATARRQIEGVRSVQVSRVVRRLPSPGPLAFGRGLAITVQVDDLAFEGSSAFLLGSVLDQYFGRYVSINSFTETVLRSDGRGEINRWMPQWGARPTL
jgi:type VI secretion system protein ImpG